MKKTLIVVLTLLLPIAWVWAAGEEIAPGVNYEGAMNAPVDQGNLLDSTNPIPDPPVIATNLVTQDFEGTWDPGTPPAGWTILDNGTEGSQAWWEDDWYKYYYSTFGDTTARIYYLYSQETDYDEWLISPSLAVSGTATSCSLSWQNYYNDHAAGQDTAYVKITTDGGSNWINLLIWDEDHYTSPYYEYLDLTAFIGQTIQIAYNLTCNTGIYSGITDWKVDEVNVWTNEGSLLSEEFDNWGTGGNNPPTGWTILDNGTPKAAAGTWNNNDFYQYSVSGWGSNVARVYYESSYREWQDEWLISPSFAITAAVECTLSVSEYYYHSSTAPWGGYDHGYILITTDAGSNWNTIYDNDATKGSSSTENVYQYDLSAYAGQTCQVAFNFVNSPYGYDYWYIDNVSVDEYVPPSEDLGVVSIDSPPVFLYNGDSYPLTATIESFAADPSLVDSIEFKVEDSTPTVVFSETTYPGVSVPGYGSQQFSTVGQWNPTTDGYYTATVTLYDTGDANPLNDSYATGKIVQSVNFTYPFYEDFEDTLAKWTGLGDGIGWTAINNHGGIVGLWLDSDSPIPATRVAVSEPIYITGADSPILKFWEKSGGSISPDETHAIGFVPGDWSLANFDTLFYDDSTSTLSSTYRQSIADAGSISEGDTLRLVIWYHVETAAANDWYIDDLALTDGAGDAGPTAFTSGTTAAKNQPYSPAVEITNFGIDTLDVPVKLVIDSMGTNVYTAWDTLFAMPALGVDTATFADYTPLMGGSSVYTMTATIEISSVLLDNNPGNDTLSTSLIVFEEFYDFESSDAGLRATNEWEWGTPTNVGPASAYSGVNCWGTDLDDYRDHGSSGNPFISDLDFFLDLGTDNDAVFSFVHWYQASSAGYDSLTVKIDAGGGWVTLADWNLNSSDEWLPVSIDLSAYTGIVAMRLELWSTSGVSTYAGWYVDDFGLASCVMWYPADDVAAVSIDDPSGFIFTESTVSPKGTVRNLGTDAQTFDAIMTVEDTATVIANVIYADTVQVVSLAGGASQQVTFANWNVPSGDAETYTFTLTADNPGDYNTADNTVSAAFDAYTHYAEGGPDAFGYQYFDMYSSDPLAPTYSWVELSTSPTADTAGTSSGSLGHFPIGFPFVYYGTTYDSVFINGYGYVTFGTTLSSSGNDCPVPSSSTPNDPMIMGFWDYGYPYGTYDGATIYETFGTTPNQYMVIQYHNFRYSTYYDDMDFEIILQENGDVLMQYKHVGSPETSGNYGYGKYETVGIEDYDQYTAGLSYICNDDHIGNRLQDGLAILWHYEAPAIDVAMSSVDEPLDGSVVINGTVVTPTVTLTNLGGSATTVDVTFQILDNSATVVYNQTETTASIPGGNGTLQHSFSTTWNADTDGDYDVVAYLTLAGDSNPANDTANTTFEVATHYSQGGPDEYGYRYIDNQGGGAILEDPPVFNWIDLTTSPTADTAGTSSGNLGHFPIGFDFDFYGSTFDSVYINGYGYLQFGNYYSTSGNDCPLPSTTSPYYYQICGFWDAGYPSGTYAGATIYETFGTAPDRYMVVQYHNHRYLTYYNDIDFEIIIYENGDIIMQYLNVAEEATNYGVGQSATVGIQSDTSGTRYGMTYLCNDDPVGNELVDSLAIKWYFPIFAHDVVVQQFNSPDPSGLVNVAFTPEVVFYNNGTSDETNVPVRLLIEPGGYNDVQNIATLDSGTAVAQQFTNFTPTSTGMYTLTAINELVGDEDPLFDTLVMYFYAYESVIDFEADNGGLSGTGDWAWGTPTSGPGSAHSGSNLWATNLDGNYTANTFSTLEFPITVGTTDPMIGIASWYDTELRFDGGNFAVSTDDGTTWIVISPDIGYVDTSYTPPIEGDSVFTGHDQQFWEIANFDLSAYSGLDIKGRFAFMPDGSVQFAGWYIDDIGLVDCVIGEADIVVSPLSVSGEAIEGEADYDTITVSNTGTAVLDFTVNVVMDEIFTDANGQTQRLDISDPVNIRRVPADISSVASNMTYEEMLQLEQRKASGEKVDIPLSYSAPSIPLPVIAVDIVSENFDDGLLPAGWSIVDGGTTNDTWMLHSTSSCPRSDPAWSVDWMIVDSDCAGSGNTLDEQLLTSYYDLSSYAPVHLAFNHYFNNLTSDSCHVEVRNGSTGTWTLVAGYYADVSASEDYDISSMIGAGDSVQVRFWYWDNNVWAWYWGIDDFLLYEADQPWLSVGTNSGSIPPAGSPVDIEVIFNAEDVLAGVYTGSIEISSNDPDEPLVSVPATFTVTPAGCDYVVGDVNGSSSYNGLDITYGVAYFKGGNEPFCEYGSCPIPPCDAFFYCGDVNGSCTYNGLDITYGVAYFKGGSGPIACPSCPPVGAPASIGGQELKPAPQGNQFKSGSQPTIDTKSKSKKGNSLKR